LQKVVFVVEILTKHGRGLLLFAAPRTAVFQAKSVSCTRTFTNFHQNSTQETYTSFVGV